MFRDLRALRNIAAHAKECGLKVVNLTADEVLALAERVETAEGNAQRVAEQHIARANAGAIDIDREDMRTAMLEVLASTPYASIEFAPGMKYLKETITAGLSAVLADECCYRRNPCRHGLSVIPDAAAYGAESTCGNRAPHEAHLLCPECEDARPCFDHVHGECPGAALADNAS